MTVKSSGKREAVSSVLSLKIAIYKGKLKDISPVLYVAFAVISPEKLATSKVADKSVISAPFQCASKEGIVKLPSTKARFPCAITG